tara:strand:+ start:12727 stop:16218 length:3492 start_codon:yes stop_codon:yes gene_type:complete
MGIISGQSLLPTDRDEILRVIRQVRNRWRLRIALRGFAVVIAALLGTLVVSAWGLEVYRFTPAAIITFRIVTYGALLGFGWWFFVRPLLRHVSDEQVALYLEEHEPSLQAAVLSAVEETRKGDRAAGLDYSPKLVGKLVESAAEKIRDVDMGRAVEHQRIQGSSGWLAAGVVLALLLFLFGPTYLRHGVMALLTPMGSAEAASPYRIAVFPGDATIARGSDQAITATLDGFGTDQVTLFVRSNESVPFERLPLIPLEDPGLFEVLLFDVQESTDYFVEAVGVESGTFTLEVVDLPYVERLEHEYVFPSYTGLEPRLVEEGGDIAVLSGTEVRLRAFPTLSTSGGQMVLDEENETDLVVEPDGSLTGRFVVEKDGFYRIDLESSEGEMVTASPQFTIDVLTDQPPSVMFLNPGRDTTASAIEELFIEARADDDFGLRSLDLVYSVNGGSEETVRLYSGGENALTEVAAGHTFFLEDLPLEPGDFVSYYARATDRNLAQENKDVKSDLYFVQIRAFSRDFRAGQSQGGGGGGAGGADPRALSEAQKEIVSGTFNVVRDEDSYSAEEYQENVVFLTLAQGRLREQVETLLRRMNSRVMPADPAFRSISEILPQAADAMREAEEQLQDQDADGALPPEQRALQFLQRAEEAYEEVMVQMGGGGGGGGGSQSQAAEDLADLFELELDKFQNQYETMQRGEQQQADNTVDELMERLRELARRQEREAERQQRRFRGQQSAQGGGTAAQRELAEEAEEAARRLERLARDQNSPQMMDAARRLQQAADAMRRAAANSDNLGFSEAGAALDRLREVQDRLRQEQTGRLERDIDEALRRANRLADEEREVASGVSRLPGLNDEQRLEQLRGLMERKDAMEAEVADLERQIDSTSAEFRREERNSSRSLQDAANSIRDNKLKEKIRYTKGVIRSRASDTAEAFEEQITNDIEDLREHLRAAAEAVGNTQGDALTEALDQTRDLMRGLDSLEHRMWSENENQSGEEGQQGQGQGGQQAGQTGSGQQGSEQPNPADGQPGVGDSLGGAYAGGGYGNRRPTEFDPDDIRQWQREFRQRLGEAQDIRRALQEEEFSAGDLDEIIRQMQQLDDTRMYQDSEEIARLQSFLREELKRFEYRLRREIDDENEDLFLASSDDVPPGFRDMIEEYYRALSREN